jgi:hypothetical protein
VLGTRRGGDTEDYALARDLEGRLNLGPGEARTLPRLQPHAPPLRVHMHCSSSCGGTLRRCGSLAG